MKASAGDRILIAAAALGKPVRDGEILEVRGPLGTPPYLVAWSDGGAHTLFFPGLTRNSSTTRTNQKICRKRIGHHPA